MADWLRVEAIVAEIANDLGGIDVLINNAGVGHGGKIEDMKPEEISHTFSVNVVGILYMTKAVVPVMKKQGDGWIININSQSGLYTKPERAVYSGSKWALTGITKVLQSELAANGIRVTGLYPGALELSVDKQGKHHPQQNGIVYQEMIDAVEFVLGRGPGTVVPELGVKNILN